MSVRRQATLPPAPGKSRLEHVLSVGLNAESKDGSMSDMKSMKHDPLTKEQSKALLDEIKKNWKGAKRPVHWSSTSAKKLSEALIADYKTVFQEQQWENVKLAEDAGRCYHVDTGTNMHAEIKISAKHVWVQVFVTEFDADGKPLELAGKVKSSEDEDLGGERMVTVTNYKAITEVIDGLLVTAVEEVKATMA